jgi:hypothetical protein
VRFEVFSRRWGHNDSYRVERTEEGWTISYHAIGGPCDPTGEPYLYDNLRQDGINYPADLGSYLAWLWERAKTENLSDDEIQKYLDQLGQWIQITERNTPGGIFEAYG